MKNVSQRLLALAIAFVMVVGMIPVGATVVSAEAAAPYNCKHCDEAVEWLPLNSETVDSYYTGATTAQLEAGTHNSFESGHYYLTDDVSVKGIDLRNAGQIVIELNGFTYSNTSSRMFRIAGSSSVTFQDSSVAQTGKVMPGKDYSMGTVAYVASSSTFAMYGGTIDGSNANATGNDNKGGAIRMESKGKSVTLEGVTVTNCDATGTSGAGGAISATTGTINITDCTFTNCTSAKNGGAIYGTACTIVIDNTDFSYCTASNAAGGAIYGGSSSNVTLQNGCSIKNCSAKNGGSAILTLATLNVTDTEMSANTATGGKGVIYLQGTGAVGNIGAGTLITGNTCTSEGALYIDSAATCYMTGGEISGNISTNTGCSVAGVNVAGTFVMSGGVVKNNSCPNSTAGSIREVLVYHSDGGANATISDNAQIIMGAEDTHAFYSHTGSATISGGSFTGVIGKGSSGTLEITGGTFTTDVTKYVADGYAYDPETGAVGMSVASVNGVEYIQLSKALENATAEYAVILLVDQTVSGALTLPDGITLDLNGKTLTVGSAATMNAKIADSSETGTGLLKVAKGQAAFASDNQLAVWNGTDGYIFTDVTWKVKALKDNNGIYKVRFIPVTNEAVAELLKDGGADNEFALNLSVSWSEGSQTLTYQDSDVAKLYDGNKGVAEENYIFTFTFTGVENFTDLKVAAYITGAAETAAYCGYEWEVV